MITYNNSLLINHNLLTTVHLGRKLDALNRDQGFDTRNSPPLHAKYFYAELHEEISLTRSPMAYKINFAAIVTSIMSKRFLVKSNLIQYGQVIV